MSALLRAAGSACLLRKFTPKFQSTCRPDILNELAQMPPSK
jgi:hypothetical protein